jgi:hypothetical protein
VQPKASPMKYANRFAGFEGVFMDLGCGRPGCYGMGSLVVAAPRRQTSSGRLHAQYLTCSGSACLGHLLESRSVNFPSGILPLSFTKLQQWLNTTCLIIVVTMTPKYQHAKTCTCNVGRGMGVYCYCWTSTNEDSCSHRWPLQADPNAPVISLPWVVCRSCQGSTQRQCRRWLELPAIETTSCHHVYYKKISYALQ